ncbi:hypothetical protein M885DRAFT_528074 [Pelagophyceae sp. CCMP2097]|nr:hypothetical protein M885DRAFT_528074 [Pelagophyceae sp. CCMP2097]
MGVDLTMESPSPSPLSVRGGGKSKRVHTGRTNQFVHRSARASLDQGAQTASMPSLGGGSTPSSCRVADDMATVGVPRRRPGSREVDRSAAFRPRDVPRRDLQAATWDSRVVSTEALWQTESATAFCAPAAADAPEGDGVKWRLRAIDGQNRALFVRARDKLYSVACHKYGSLAGMDRDFRSALPAAVSLDDFSTALKRRGLERLFPREQQRIIFETLAKPPETNGGDRMALADLFKFLDSDQQLSGESLGEAALDAALPRAPKVGAVHRVVDNVEGQGAAVAGLFVKEQMPPNIRAVKDQIIDAVFAKLRAAKQQEDVSAHTDFVMNTFKQWDSNMSGNLSPREVVQVLGPGHLNLGIHARDMKAFIDYIDTDNDGQISYKEFVRAMEITDIEPDYNPFFDQRRRELVNLQRIVKEPVVAVDVPVARPFDAHDETRTFLRTATATAAFAATAPARGLGAGGGAADHPDGYFKPLATSQQMRALRDGAAESRARTASSFGGSGARTADDVFGAMSLTATRSLAGICPRFSSPPPTDWGRTGIGGDGIFKGTASYNAPEDRFRTTSAHYFRPLAYGALDVTRDGPSDARAEHDARAATSDARIERSTRNRAVIADLHARDAAVALAKGEACRRHKSGQMYEYFKATYEKDLVQLHKIPPDAMQRTRHPKSFTAMWGGSPQNMLHHSNTGAHSDMQTTSMAATRGVAESIGRKISGVKR